MSLFVKNVEVFDIRVPTSDSLLGSDPFHKKPNYSCVYTTIELSNGIEKVILNPQFKLAESF